MILSISIIGNFIIFASHHVFYPGRKFNMRNTEGNMAISSRSKLLEYIKVHHISQDTLNPKDYEMDKN